MSKKSASERFTTRSHRLVKLVNYLLIFVFAFRRIYEPEGAPFTNPALIFILFFTILFASEPLLSKHYRAYPRIYFTVQFILVQTLGLFQEYIDAWAILFIILGFQVVLRCSRREALLWGGLFIVSILVSFFFEFGLVSGFGRAMAYVVIGLFLISYDIQVAQHEDALEESQMLLAELHEAHEKLQAYAAQADQLAAAQERDRMVQELYDSVGQKVFAIQLAAEATRLMLPRDPKRAAAQLTDLQAQAQATLGQMRQLIAQWRPS